jgi:drug/metabolite transporter (DMT)-like permease
MFQSTGSKVIAGYILISVIWGSTWLAIKIGLESIPPFFGAAVRFLLATAILFLIVRIRKTNIPRDSRSVRLYVVVGLSSFSFGYALVYWAQQFVPSGLAAILFATYPFFVAIMSWFTLRNESFSVTKLTGIILGFSGIIVIFSEDLTLHFNDGLMAGMVGIVLAAAVQSVSAVTVKRYGERLSPFALNAVGMAIGTVILFLISFITEDLSTIVVDGKAIGSVLYLSTLGSVVTFGTFFWLLKRMEAVILSLSAFITPIVAMVLGIIIAGEVFTGKILIGSVLVLLGIIVANLRPLIRVIKNRYVIRRSGNTNS